MFHKVRQCVPLLLLAFVFVPAAVGAQVSQGDIIGQIDAGGQGAGIITSSSTSTPPQVIIVELISVVLTITGILFTSLIVYAGYLRYASNGDEERIKKSTRVLQGAIIGLIITLMSYAITLFVGTRINNATRGPDGGDQLYDIEDDPHIGDVSPF